ncbi:MAG: hypothetical protein LBJ93_02905, partial [Clostridiales bacterium]|nr:hypothetical protein [Clostridiales bacterium]
IEAEGIAVENRQEAINAFLRQDEHQNYVALTPNQVAGINAQVAQRAAGREAAPPEAAPAPQRTVPAIPQNGTLDEYKRDGRERINQLTDFYAANFHLDTRGILGDRIHQLYQALEGAKTPEAARHNIERINELQGQIEMQHFNFETLQGNAERTDGAAATTRPSGAMFVAEEKTNNGSNTFRFSADPSLSRTLIEHNLPPRKLMSAFSNIAVLPRVKADIFCQNFKAGIERLNSNQEFRNSLGLKPGETIEATVLKTRGKLSLQFVKKGPRGQRSRMIDMENAGRAGVALDMITNEAISVISQPEIDNAKSTGISLTGDSRNIPKGREHALANQKLFRIMRAEKRSLEADVKAGKPITPGRIEQIEGRMQILKVEYPGQSAYIDDFCNKISQAKENLLAMPLEGTKSLHAAFKNVARALKENGTSKDSVATSDKVKNVFSALRDRLRSPIKTGPTQAEASEI